MPSAPGNARRPCDSVDLHTGDCAELPLNDKSLVEHLWQRYRQGLIYTKASHVLLAINPHRCLEHLYEKPVIEQPLVVRGPHPYSVTQLALKSLSQGPQAIVVSGESGAGKTETTKIIMRFMESTTSCEAGLERRIVAMSRVLESLGHAATRQNSNSSRFGKFLRLQRTRSGLSAEVSTYLLEASRVVSGAPRFRIFEELGGDENHKGRGELFGALSQLGLAELGQQMPEVIASISHILDYLAPSTQRSGSLEAACRLLGMQVSNLMEVLSSKQLLTPRETIVLQRSEEQSRGILRSLAVLIYQRLFQHVVCEMNAALSLGATGPEMGILDMYGFENLEVNSLEQLLINYTNERLQLLFWDQILLKEQQLYVSEGLLEVPLLTSSSSHEVLEDLDGSLDLLDDWCLRRLRAGGNLSDQGLADAARRKHARLRPAPAPGFAVRHYAEEVSYRCMGWLDANDARPLPEVLQVLEDSRFPWLQRLQVDGRCRSHSVNKKHRSDLGALLGKLQSMRLHFIRCFRPNKEQSGSWVDRSFLLRQLRGGSIPQLLQVVSRGYPHRIPLNKVASSFAHCFPGAEACSKRLLAEVLMCAFQVPRDEWRVGVSHLFLKSGQLQVLEELTDGCNLDPLLLAAARRKAQRLRWRSAVHAVQLSFYLAKQLRLRRRRRMQACFRAVLFLCRASRVARAARARAEAKKRRPATPHSPRAPCAAEVLEVEAPEEVTEAAEFEMDVIDRNRVLLVLPRKRRLCA